VIESILLTDSDQEAVDQAVGQLEGWGLRRVSSADLVSGLAGDGVRAVLV